MGISSTNSLAAFLAKGSRDFPVGADVTGAAGINESGVGLFTTADGNTFETSAGGSVVRLPSLAGGGTFGTAINDSGQAVGYGTTTAGDPRAFLFTPGQGIQNLGILHNGLPVTFSEATALNNLGAVVGDTDANGSKLAFLYFGGVMTDLNTLLPAQSGWQLTAANGINDAGQIVGIGIIGGETRGYILDASDFLAASGAGATPEPGSWSLLVLGGVALAIRRKLGAF